MRLGERVNDALRRGLGRVGRASGAWCDVYRPRGRGAALAPGNRVLRMQAAFGPPGEGWRTPGYGGTVWYGFFDAAYTRVGDYVLRAESRAGALDGGIWFIAAQEPMLPLLCVRASRIVNVARPAGATQQGVNSYGGIARSYSTALLTQWPAAITASGAAGATGETLPSDVSPGGWLILLPAHQGVTIRTGDIVSDDLGRTAIVAGAELTQLGWRVLARQATT